MIQIYPDKIGSVTRNLDLGRTLILDEYVHAEHGAVVAGRILNDKTVYNKLEDVHGRLTTVHSDDIVVGALGHRNALHGYEGVLPEHVRAGQRLQVLNQGGVLGTCVAHNPDVGPPFEIEVLGQVQLYRQFGQRRSEPANVRMAALTQGASSSLPRVPVIYVAGTCMNAGKTAAACAIVRNLVRAGYRVGGAKLTGVSLMRDVLSMRDYGAEVTLDFTDVGIVCTGPDTAAQVAHVIFTAMAARGVDIVVAETGDGIMGEYGVQAILADQALRESRIGFAFCANDPVGAAGGVQHLRSKYGIEVSVVSGPATDNRVGIRFVQQVLGLDAINARAQPGKLADVFLDRLIRRTGTGG